MTMHNFLPHLTVLIMVAAHSRIKKFAKDSWQDGPLCCLKKHNPLTSSQRFFSQLNIKLDVFISASCCNRFKKPRCPHIERGMMFISAETDATLFFSGR